MSGKPLGRPKRDQESLDSAEIVESHTSLGLEENNRKRPRLDLSSPELEVLYGILEKLVTVFLLCVFIVSI